MTEPSRKLGPNAFLFIFVTVAIDSIGLGLIIPVWPDLLMELTGRDVWDAVAPGGAITATYAVMQFFFSPLIGNLSDRYGRRPVLLFSLGALAIDYVIMGLAPTLAVLFFSRALSGIFAATYSTANAFIADITPPERRGARFGMLGAAFGVGFILGPAIGGVLGAYDPRAPFFAAAGLAALNALYGVFVLPETLSQANRRPLSLSRANPFGAFRQLMRAREVSVLITATFFVQLASLVYPATWSYYTIAKFDWSSDQVGYSLTFYGVIFIISQAAVTPIAIRRLGPGRAALFSLTISTIVLLGVASAATPTALYAWISLSVLSGMTGPALQQMMTSRVGPDAQGELQGGLSSLQAIIMILSPIIYTQLFRHFADPDAAFTFIGAPYAAAATMTTLAFIFLAFVFRRAPAHA